MKVFVLSNNQWRGGAVRDAVKLSGHVLVEQDDAELMIVAGWPHKLPKEVYGKPKYGTWNCHAGPVPEYRGGSPLNWQIIDGRKEIGVSVLEMDDGLDTGPVLATGKFELRDDETIADAHAKANAMFAYLITNLLWEVGKGKWPNAVSQVGDGYRRQRTDDDGEIDFSWPKDRIVNFVRALTHPYPGAWVKLPNGERLRIWSAS